jgi:hypothetical protein
LFPSTKISRQRVTQNVQIPGFPKCSIAALLGDVGEEVDYQMQIELDSGLEDRVVTLENQINAHLGIRGRQGYLVQSQTEPQSPVGRGLYRITQNAERMELFFNARKSELVSETAAFVCSEYLRQVAFGKGSEVSIPREVDKLWPTMHAFGRGGSQIRKLLSRSREAC